MSTYDSDGARGEDLVLRQNDEIRYISEHVDNGDERQRYANGFRQIPNREQKEKWFVRKIAKNGEWLIASSLFPDFTFCE